MAAEPGNRSSTAQTADRDLVITRVFDAPRELVFQAWIEPERLKNWWGPGGFTNPVCEIDARNGGAMRIHMRAPDGTVHPMTGTFHEVVPPERLVFSSGPVDADNNLIFEVLTTVLFEAQGNKTKVTLRASVVRKTALADQYLPGMETGWSQSLDRLAAEVAQMPTKAEEFVVSRVFDAPRQRVWEAFTEARHLAQWWGPKGFTVHVAKLDLRPGGVFHYSEKAPNGQVIWGKFVYREIQAPERLVFVSSFSDEHGNTTRNPWMPVWPLEILNNVTFTEQDGKTTVRLAGGPINATAEEQKTFLDFRDSMDQGFAGTFATLAEYLAKM